MRHPKRLLRMPVESLVVDTRNPNVLRQHVLLAAQEQERHAPAERHYVMCEYHVASILILTRTRVKVALALAQTPCKSNPPPVLILLVALMRIRIRIPIRILMRMPILILRLMLRVILTYPKLQYEFQPSHLPGAAAAARAH